MALNEIEHTKTKARHPQTNGICERFHKTVQQEFYQPTLRRKIYDVELQASTFIDFLPGLFANTGAKVNYTYVTAENVDDFNPLTGEQMPLRGQSENSYNLEAFYEDSNWSAKIAYNYRDEFYSRVFDGLPVFVESSGYIDGKISYTLNDSLKFYVDARNLGKEVKVETSGVGRTNDLQWSGRTFSLGFTYKM